MLQIDPTVKGLRRSHILSLLALAPGIFIIVLDLTKGNIDTSFGGKLFWDSIILLAGIALIPLALLRGRFWKRLEQRRQKAALGDYSFLAAEQPAPDATALPLPTTIKQRMSKRFRLISITLFMVGDIIVFGDLLARNHFSIGDAFFALFVILFATLITFGVALAAIFSQLYQQLEVTEEGLTSNYMHKMSSIRWDGATFFAVYNNNSIQKSKYVNIYELSSINATVKWSRYQYRRKGSMLVDLKATPEEYNRQTAALNSLIVAKTGLPLYDLRDGRQKGGQRR